MNVCFMLSFSPAGECFKTQVVQTVLRLIIQNALTTVRVSLRIMGNSFFLNIFLFHFHILKNSSYLGALS